ncbi:HAMP domain-containing sensor histidine kinase [Desulfonatronum sp. SC1]|uniref:HAMP domain-containing sensor histidine kinase n=1 Tax=Desulfonatronum sp. SC1 TaxID=2109626 RepID=UPI0013050047|nr:HAMP domain-containing sensor histidine kinase [Desulfonatronum sp. SC1]
MGRESIPLRIGVTTKLLVWSLALITIFYIITFSLFWGIKDVVSTSGRIVSEDFARVAKSDQVMGTLLSYLENLRKYEILGREEYLSASWDHLETLRFLVGGFVIQGDPSPGISFLQADLAKYLHNGDHAELPGEERTERWITLISMDRLNLFERINVSVQEIYARGAAAYRWGLVGLAAATFLGVAASLGIALHLNRSLREIRLGISRMANDEEFQPIRTNSSDELGELAGAFNEMAERLEVEARMRAEFISMLSHEIRTPLTSIREAVSLVQDGVLGTVDQRQSAYLDIAQKEARRLSDLLAKLMQISNLGSKRIDLSVQALSLLDLVREAIQRIQPIAVKKSIIVEAPRLQEFVWVLADKEHIQQVLFNLLGNALKFAPCGSLVTINITVLEASSMVKTCVMDQGPGIPPGERKYVFQRFYRGENVQKISDGAGLGLSISRRIIEAHSGEIWLENTSSTGSAFCFTLPLVTDHQA